MAPLAKDLIEIMEILLLLRQEGALSHFHLVRNRRLQELHKPMERRFTPKSSVYSNGVNDRKRFAREVNQSAKRSCFHGSRSFSKS